MSWKYLGQFGRHGVDFFVLISLISAAINYQAGTVGSLSSIWGTFGSYLGIQGAMVFLQNFYLGNAKIYIENHTVESVETNIVIDDVSSELTLEF